MKISIGIVDDHQLFLKSLSLMLQSFNNYDVVIEAANGKDLQENEWKEREFYFNKVSLFNYQTMRRCDEVYHLRKVMIRFGIQCCEWLNVRKYGD